MYVSYYHSFSSKKIHSKVCQLVIVFSLNHYFRRKLGWTKYPLDELELFDFAEDNFDPGLNSSRSCESLEAEPNSSSSFKSLEDDVGLGGICDWYQSRLSSRVSKISWAPGWTKSAHVSHKGWTM